MFEYNIIDISVWMDAFTFPGNPEWNVRGPVNRVEGKNPEYVYDFELCTQSGTHIQGPHYFIGDGKRINEFPLGGFEGLAYILDLDKRGCDTSREDLEELLGSIQLAGKILILRTGHMEELIRSKVLDPARRPGLSLDAAEYLCETKKIKMIAIDSVGVESRVSADYDVNVYLCSQGILILECLANLHAIKAKEVWLEAFPLKIAGVEGAPCRAIVKEYF